MGTSHKGVVALIAGAGVGTRLGYGPKAFLQLGGKTLLRIAVEKFVEFSDRIRVAVAASQLSQALSELSDLDGNIEVVVGSATRQGTFMQLLDGCQEAIVLAHEVARPFASRQLIRRVLDASGGGDAVLPVCRSPTPIVSRASGRLTSWISSNDAGIPQAPQAYRNAVVTSALQAVHAEGKQFHTLWQPVDLAGHVVRVVEGDPWNFKITTSVDWQLAQQIAPDLLGE